MRGRRGREADADPCKSSTPSAFAAESTSPTPSRGSRRGASSSFSSSPPALPSAARRCPSRSSLPSGWDCSERSRWRSGGTTRRSPSACSCSPSCGSSRPHPITFYLGLLALWLAAYVASVRSARVVVLAYLAGATLSAVAACLALIVAFPGSDALVTGPRAQGMFKDPNVFGPFLVPAALILMEETVAPRLLRFRLTTKLVLLSVLTVGVLFSFSRAAWLNLAVGVLVLLTVLALRRGGARRALTLLAVALVAGAALVAVVEATSMTSFLSQRAALQDYDAQRFGAQASGVEIAERHPLGLGPGQFERVSDLSAHSTYVRTLTEEGILGVLLLLGLLVLTLGFAARNVALGVDTYGIGSAALLAAWCGLLANSFFVDTLHWRHFWLVAALIWAGTALREGYPGR